MPIPDARVMLITQQRIPVPDSQDRDCVKIAGMALVYAQPVRPAADVPWRDNGGPYGQGFRSGAHLLNRNFRENRRKGQIWI